MKEQRIINLDSFRGIAILMVIFFHFFSRWTSLYPYENKYDFFGYGKFGVHFFFMISGFVIFYTLESTKSLKQFWFNRYVRLFPAMFFASILTYLFFIYFDNDFLFPTSHYFKNILVSLSFIQPELVSSIMSYKIDFDYISGSYWSLWVEIQFYFFASFFYFIVSKKKHIYFFTTAIATVVFSWLLSHIYNDAYIFVKLKSYREIFNLVDSLPFFCLGVVFYIFYENNRKQVKNSLALLSVFLFFVFFLIFTNLFDFTKIFLIITFVSLFLLMIYSPERITFLNNYFLNKIGISSYFLYLIHENIGVFLIHEEYIQINSLSFLVPIFYMIVFIVVSVIFTSNIEIKIIRLLKGFCKF